jgi:serine/threonine-protein kinase
MVELRALGAIDLRRDGTEIAAVLTQPKRLALLLYLDFARPHGFHRRDRLVAMLWPELDDSHARNALSKAIHHIRKELGESAIATRGDEVMLDPVYIRSDVRVLEAALANSDHMRAVQLYQGPLADGFFVEEAPEFERWLADQRDRIKNSVSEAAWSLAENAKQQGRISDATMFARSAVLLTRDDEPSIRRLMRFLESVGDRAGALRAYDEFAVWISGELDAVPSPDTDALRDTIKNSEKVHLTGENPTLSSPPAGTPTPQKPVTTAIPATPEKKERIHWAAVGVAAVALILFLAAYVFRPRSDASPQTSSTAAAIDPRRVSVMPFENHTGDHAYDSVGVMAMDWISQDIAASGLVSVVDPRSSAKAGAGLVISGSYDREGDHLSFKGQLSLASTGTISRVFKPVSAPFNQPTTAFDSVALQATGAIAEVTDARVSAFPRSGRNPPSYAAYREFVQGAEDFVHHKDSTAYLHFMRAYQIDTTFTTALLNAGASIYNRFSGADSVIALLKARRSSMTRFNQMWLDSYLAAKASDIQTAMQLEGELARQAPGSFFPLAYASAAVVQNRPRIALTTLLQVDPERGWMKDTFDYWYTRCNARHLLGDYEAELADSRLAVRQYPANFSVLSCQLRALASLGREQVIDSVLDAAAGMPEHDSWNVGSPYSVVAAEAEFHGYPRIAEKARRRTVEWVSALPAKELDEPDRRLFGPSWQLFYAGAWPELLKRARHFREKTPDDNFWITFEGIAAAHFGDRRTAMFADSVLQVIGKPGGDKRFGSQWVAFTLYHRA